MKRPGIVWEEPAEIVRHRRNNYTKLIEALKSNPKRWARIMTYGNRGAANSMRYILTKRYPFLELTVRTGEKGKIFVFARFLPSGRLRAAKKARRRGQR